MHEKLQDLTSYFLVTTGTTTAAITLSNWTNLDLAMSLILKFVSLASFICFILINQDNIATGYRKAINKLYNKLKGKK
jgi:hypothetical protein